jgi:predicted dehydrogenase
VAERHVAALRAAGDRVAAVVDPSAERRAKLSPDAGGAATLDDHLNGGPTVDAAIVASPSVDHLEQATALAGRGIPVLLEKPHRIPGQEPEPLLRASRATGTPIMVGMTTRFSAGVRAAREAIVSGALGDPVWIADRIWFSLAPGALADWYFARGRSGGGVLLTNGVHALDRCAWLLGEPLELLDVRLADAQGCGVEDVAHVRLRSSGGVAVDVSLMWSAAPVGSGGLRVVGTGGVARVAADGAWSIATSGGMYTGRAEDELAPFRRQWEAFTAALDGDGDGAPGVEELERTLALIEAAYDRAGIAA